MNQNIVWTFALFWYQIYNNFDITYLFDYTYVLLVNLAFTSLPVILMGILDQDVTDKVSLAVPQLYRKGMERREWSQLKFWLYMADGIYQSAICYFLGYLLFAPATFNTWNGRDVADRGRMGVYIACATITVVNTYILLNTYRWDWLMLLITAISTLLIFFWTGVYSSFQSSFQFYKSAAEVYSTLTFWALLLLILTVCLMPRFCAKFYQKNYRPYDVDIIREQVRQGKFDYLEQYSAASLPPKATVSSGASSDTADVGVEDTQSKAENGHQRYASMSESARPMYPPSLANTNATRQPHSQTGSDDTNGTLPSFDFTRSANQRRPSLDRIVTVPQSERAPLHTRTHTPVRPSLERIRSSGERTHTRLSFDRMRPSFEQSRDFTSAAYLTRIESSYSTPPVTPGVTPRSRFDIPEDVIGEGGKLGT